MATKNANTGTTDWLAWRYFFERRSDRPLPKLNLKAETSMVPASLARSLAVFQLGETGDGTIIRQVMHAGLPGIDKHHMHAVASLIDEECRHANILAMCVRMLGGELIRKNWTARMFVITRRMFGLRVKVTIMMAAEIIGMCYYAAIAEKLQRGPVRRYLTQLVGDKRAHVDFHCQFLRSQMKSAWQRRIFAVAWRTLMRAAVVVVNIEHRRTIREMKLDRECTHQRWKAYSQMAERLVTDFPIGASNYVSDCRTV